MGIKVRGPDGVVIEFPDGTAPEMIGQVMSSRTMKPSAPEVGVGEALGRGALQGATFGFGDEIYGGVKGAASYLSGGGFSDTYERERDAVRAANKKAAEAQPIAYIGGEVAGGVASTLVPGLGFAGRGAQSANAVKEVATVGNRMAQGAKAAAAPSALMGFGTGEGGVENRVLNAGISGAVGAGVGAAAPVVVDTAAAITRGITNPVRAAVQPAQTAQTKVGEALLRDAPPGMPLDDVASRAAQRLARARVANPDTILADVGGENSRNLLRSAANMPSEGGARLNRMLDRRASQQWSRIEKDLADTVADGNKFDETLKAWGEITNNVGRVNFRRAYEQPFNVRAGDPLARFLTERGYVQKLLQKTQDSIQGTTGDDIAKMSPWELLHRTKMEIDKQIGKLKRGQGDPADNWDLRDLSMLKREMVDLMGKANPEFNRAMVKYGDAAGMRTALEDGYEKFGTLGYRELAAEIKKMTVPERKMFQLGGMRHVFEKLESGNAMRDRTETLFSSPDMQRKIALISKHWNADGTASNIGRNELWRRLVLHARQADTRKAVQGNSTTAKQLAQADEAGQLAAPIQAVQTGMDALQGRFGPAMNYIGRQAQRFNGMTPNVANEVINTMMDKSGGNLVRGLDTAVKQAALAPDARARLARQLSRGAMAGFSGAKEAD
jgi:hypothetical protein